MRSDARVRIQSSSANLTSPEYQGPAVSAQHSERGSDTIKSVVGRRSTSTGSRDPSRLILAPSGTRSMKRSARFGSVMVQPTLALQ